MDYDLLIERIKNSDMQALEELYGLLYSSVFALSLAVLKNPELASDNVQDTFLRVYSGAKTYNAQNLGRAWVLKIARNTALNSLKKSQREYSNSAFIESLKADDSFESSDVKITLHSLFAILDDSEQEIMMLRAKGYLHNEIAAILEIPEGTARWKYSAALKKLKQSQENIFADSTTGGVKNE